jgi:hypothetical protein
MNLKDILSISGYPGLFRFISQGRNGVIVESLLDGKRMNASSNLRISALDDIAIFTDDKEVPLKDILKKIFEKENGGPALDSKADNNKIKNYFSEVLPDYDREKVYVSDMKKVINWYNLLLQHQMIDLKDNPDEDSVKEKTDTDVTKE